MIEILEKYHLSEHDFEVLRAMFFGASPINAIGDESIASEMYGDREPTDAEENAIYESLNNLLKARFIERNDDYSDYTVEPLPKDLHLAVAGELIHQFAKVVDRVLPKVKEEEQNERRKKNLSRLFQDFKSFGRKPFGCYRMKEAVKLLNQNPDLVIATVAWWGDMPAGFTWCELISTEPENESYHVTQATEPRPRENWIPINEPVAVYWRNQYHEEA